MTALPAEMPAEMTVITMTGAGGPEVLVEAREAVPQPGAGEILVKVAAAGVNRPDILQRMGLYPSPKGVPDRPGLEVAGTVAAIGPGVSAYAIGDKVCALVAGGGYAQYCVVPVPQALPVPTGLSMIEAAALPETFFTVWTNVFERGRCQAGDVLLVHGGASGIGTTAVMLGEALGARVFATCHGDKRQAVEALGAERAIDYNAEDFVDVVLKATNGHGADVVLDMVGGDYTNRNLQVLAMDGRLVQIAFLHGAKAEINMAPIMMKRLTFTGSTLRTRPIAEKGAIADGLRARVWPLLASGRLKPVIDSTYPLAAAADAHRRLEAAKHVGKVVLICA
jgi:putative PIG3 family NAD(P)H quinone oxidoreductase